MKPLVIIAACIFCSIFQVQAQNKKTTSIQYAYILEFFQKTNSGWETISMKSIAKQHSSRTLAIDADYIQMFEGEAALAAAKKNGDVDTTYGENGKILDIYIPNDFYILNENPKIRRLELLPNTKIIFQSINEETPLDSRLFKLFLKNNKVIKIEEVYLP